jgi:hypothetical protein
MSSRTLSHVNWEIAKDFSEEPATFIFRVHLDYLDPENRGSKIL